ncbi:hypothetical protein ACI3KS_14260 [Microbacterium sp. ZW T5_45]|uniref:hypothetical protein n=1 Tax=Microbacterium sp. ZW T5_45 TaxID=3378080 RepID=UPI00385509A8
MATRAHVISILDELPGPVSTTTAFGDRVSVRWHDGAVRVLDETLEEIDVRPLDDVGDDARIRAAHGVDLVAISSSAGLTLIGGRRITRDRITRDDLHVDAAVFLGEHLLATVPSADGHRVLLIDPATGATLTEQTVDADDATAFLTRHPTEHLVLAEFAMGQDGTRLMRIDVDGQHMNATEILTGQDPVFAGFSPRGDRILIAAHPSDPEVMRVLTWPELGEVGRLSASDLDAEYGLGLAACWVDDERIAAYATQDSLLVTDASLTWVQRVELPVDFAEEGELETLTPLGSDRVAAGVWTAAGRLTLVIEIADERAS